MEKQSVIFIIVALLAGFMLGLLVALSINPTTLVNKDIEIKKSLINELRGKGFFPPEPETVMDIYGKAKEIKENQLIIVLEDRFDDPLGEFLPKTMTINVNEETQMFKLQEKPFDVFDQEQKAFDKKMAEYGTGAPTDIMPPEPFDRISIKISDIKPGDTVSVFSENDFKGKSEFTATTIQVEQTTRTEEEIEMPAE